MSSLDEWFKQIEKLGEADIPMELEGEWITPREYMKKQGRI